LSLTAGDLRGYASDRAIVRAAMRNWHTGVCMKTAMAMVLGAACVIAAPFSANASAGTKDNYHEVVNAKTEEAFSQLAESVRRDMAAGGRYEFVKPTERATIDKSFAEMTSLFQQRGSVDKMSEPQKVALFNSQEVVNSILTKRDSDRVICENRVPVGSHIPKTACHTYGQEEEARRGVEQDMVKLKMIQCTGAHCNGS
jgi:hypothetical protein